MDKQLKQPKGLGFLFFTELWERFGFYTQQTILVLYLVQSLGFSDTRAYLLYGTFTGMQFLTPALGGYIAGKYLGYQRSIIIGGLLFVLGYILSALPGTSLFFIGLSILIVANGLFKPNISSIVGCLYEENDPRREAGFTWFYMGINIGALLPPLFIGAVVTHWGWHIGFAFAAAGMALAVINFALGCKRLGDHGAMPTNSPLQKRNVRLPFYLLFTLSIIALIFVFNLGFKFPEETDTIVVFVTILCVLAAIFFTLKEPREIRNKMIACLLLIFISIGFWAIYNETFSSLMLFADRNMSKPFLWFTIDAEFTQFFNPFFIFMLSPLLSFIWIKLGVHKKNPAAPFKFALGILCLAIGFYVLAIGVQYNHHDGLSSPWWLALSYFIQTTGELLLSPIGLAMITVLAPQKYIGMMMGLWFLALSSAYALSGTLASLASTPENLNPAQTLPIYIHAFYIYGTIALILSLIAFLAMPFLNRLINQR